jgi:type IV secretory pathway VirB6-like protein
MMIARLVKKETDTAQATDQTAQATGQTATATPNLAATTKKISGAGLRAVSPVRDHATSLTGQHALNVALLPLSDYYRSWLGVR